MLYSLQRLVHHSLLACARPLPPAAEEALLLAVYEAMQGPRRNFHTTEHLLDISRGMSPLQCLAILYHDSVYWNVDGGLPPSLASLLQPLLERQDGALYLTDGSACCWPQGWQLCLAVFGMGPGPAPMKGFNELMSAAAAVLSLHEWLTEGQLLHVAACIEATIPFRTAVDVPPHGPTEALYQRVAAYAHAHLPHLAEADLERMIYQAVEVANADVGNFASDDVAEFLTYSWWLMPEHTPQLVHPELYTAGQYRRSIMGTGLLLQHLRPDQVFDSWRGVPQPAVLSKMTAAAAQNLHHGTRYLLAKAIAACLIEALAIVSGGDAPLTYLLGPQVPATGIALPRVATSLPPLPACTPPADEDKVLYQLLEHGRTRPDGFDTHRSAITLYLYRRMGAGAFWQLLPAATQFHEGKLDAMGLLGCFDPTVVGEIADAIGQVAVLRGERLKGLYVHT